MPEKEKNTIFIATSFSQCKCQKKVKYDHSLISNANVKRTQSFTDLR